jgi:hypothetical protein
VKILVLLLHASNLREVAHGQAALENVVVSYLAIAAYMSNDTAMLGIKRAHRNRSNLIGSSGVLCNILSEASSDDREMEAVDSSIP